MKAANLVLLNGNIITLDAGLRHAQAMASYDGKIVYVGDDGSARELIGPGTRTIDLQGKTALPGFNDAHVHLSTFGLELQMVDLWYPRATSVAGIKRLVAERVEVTPPGEWVRAYNYDHVKLAEGRHPTAEELDEVSPSHPVAIGHASGHMCVANSLALNMAGITRYTVPPPGGIIQKDRETGEPTGLISDQALPLLQAAIPEPTPDDVARGLALACRKFVSAGITSCTDAAPNRTCDKSHLAGFYLARERGDLSVRCNVTIGDRLFDEANRLGLMPGFGDDHLRVGAMKIYADGSIMVKTGSLFEPYQGEPDNFGEDDKTAEQLTEAVVKAHMAGWQVAIHATGDRGIHNALNAIGAAQDAYPRKDARHRIEHAHMTGPQLADKMARLGVVPVVQPSHTYYFADGYVRHLGSERARLAFPYRSLLDRGIPVVGSSDCSVTPLQPLIGIKAAIVRKTMSGEPFTPEQAVTLDEALAMYTWRGAYATFEEKLKGTLTAGKLADIVVLRDDPRRTPPRADASNCERQGN